MRRKLLFSSREKVNIATVLLRNSWPKNVSFILLMINHSNVIFLYFPCPTDSLQGYHEKKLLNHLLNNYNLLERPVANESDALEVRFGLTLQQIIDVVSSRPKQILKITFLFPFVLLIYFRFFGWTSLSFLRSCLLFYYKNCWLLKRWNKKSFFCYVFVTIHKSQISSTSQRWHNTS